MEYEWDDIEVDYPSHLLKQIEKFEEAYSHPKTERGNSTAIFFFLTLSL